MTEETKAEIDALAKAWKEDRAIIANLGSRIAKLEADRNMAQATTKKLAEIIDKQNDAMIEMKATLESLGKDVRRVELANVRF